MTIARTASWMLVLFGALVAAAASSRSAWAQSEADCPPAPTNMPNAGYPRVCPDYRVMFKLQAPGARKVQLEPNVGGNPNGMGKGPFDMTKGPDGVWSVTIGPVQPGFHHYHFVVDGLAVNDPGSDTYTNSLGRLSTWGLNRATSGLEVPEKGVDFFLPRDVPHGVVQELWYKAKTTGEFRRANVYVPPGYDKSLTTRYPVLYLQHGGTNDETSWVREGRVSFIMDNLLAEKKIVPMLVVMERSYGTIAGTSQQQTVPYDPELYKAAEAKSRDTFTQIVVNDLIPTIDGRYRTFPDREHRALAGLSGGAQQAMLTGLANLETFAYLGDFSGPSVASNYLANPASAYGGVLTKPDVLNSKLKLFYVADGTAEATYKNQLQFHQSLEKTGVRHVYYEVPGTAHEWASWRLHLVDFAPRLFAATR